METKSNKVLLNKKKNKRYKGDVSNSLKVIYEGKVNIFYDEIIDSYVFENDKFTTSDVFEGISLLIHYIADKNDPVWNINIYNISNYMCDYEGGLYILSGGYEEWNYGFHYCKKWFDVVDNYVIEFKDIINDILSNATNLRCIRANILKKLSLPILYNFALKKKIINFK